MCLCMCVTEMAVCECNAAAAAPVAGIPDSRYCLGGLLLVCLKK